ncbi:MAG: PEP-utilizing enzyme [Candidatus Aenigmatarchaeota archaeon]
MKQQLIKSKELVGEGIIASSGYASGYAFIANDIQEALTKKLNKYSYVLVSKYTTPDLLVVMYNSKGIVTEIGGVTSHAAYVAREFSIPCIVGVENVTRKINDFDEIIVDAEGNIQDIGKIYKVKKL